jgi:hypothetical protein
MMSVFTTWILQFMATRSQGRFPVPNRLRQAALPRFQQLGTRSATVIGTLDDFDKDDHQALFEFLSWLLLLAP